MTAVRVRLIGGSLSGQVIWVEPDQVSLEVHISKGGGVHSTLTYLIDGDTASFQGEADRELGPPVPSRGKMKR
jgi:hypothetical protein